MHLLGDQYCLLRLVEAFQEKESDQTMRTFLADHREWMAIATRREDLKIRLSPEDLWKRRWNIERIRVSSNPAPFVSVKHVLGSKPADETPISL